jgi:COX assembly mitochondrial protein 2
MHPHLHTEENQKSALIPMEASRWVSANLRIDCADVIAALDECHARGFLWKMFGNCTTAKHKVNMCLRAQRLERTRLNREEAMAKREHIRKVWAELDEER